jgi:glycosyltransferase involved in cell wall biosynthesis
MTTSARANADKLQKISFIVKTYNEEKKIAACLESIFEAAKHFENPYEIIVADSNSGDNTAQIAAKYPVTVVQFLHPEDRGCGAGVQLGYQHSAGDLVFFLDGDMTLEPGFIPAAIHALAQNPKLGGVAGLMREVAIRNTFDAMRVQTGASATARDERWLNGGGIYRRAAIASAGGYAANRNLKGWEEAELGMRLRSAGWSLQRIGVAATVHDGHASGTWSLIVRHWKSKRLMANGVLIRSALGERWQLQAITLLAHPIGVVVFWLIALPLALVADRTWDSEATRAVVLFASLILFLLLAKKKNLFRTFESIVLWHVNAASLLLGMLSPMDAPSSPLRSVIVGDGNTLSSCA